MAVGGSCPVAGSVLPRPITAVDPSARGTLLTSIIERYISGLRPNRQLEALTEWPRAKPPAGGPFQKKKSRACYIVTKILKAPVASAGLTDSGTGRSFWQQARKVIAGGSIVLE